MPGRPRRSARHRRPRAADHRRRRARAAVLARCAARTAPGLCPECGVPMTTPNPDTTTSRSIRGGPSSPACSASSPETSRDGRPRSLCSRRSASSCPTNCSPSRSPTAATPTRTAACPPTSASSSSATRCSGLTITEELYHRHPERSEGDLAKLRASIVNTQALADVGRRLSDDGLGAYLLLGKGEENSGGAGQVQHPRRRGRIPARRNLSASTAPRCAREVILRLFGDLLDTAPTLGAGLDWKSSLQELTASRGLGVPCLHRHLDRARPRQGVHRDGGRSPSANTAPASGRTKKEAELKAAAAAWNALTDRAGCLNFPRSRSCGGDCTQHVAGRTITAVRVHHPRAVRRHEAGPADLTARLLDTHHHRNGSAGKVPVADAGRRVGPGGAPRDERADAARARCRTRTTCASPRCSTTAPR